jgi:CBS domain-containing protein
MEIIKFARTPPILAAPDSSVFAAISLMAENNVGAVVIVSFDRRVLGIFTERDALLKVAARRRDIDRTQLSEVMTSPVQTAVTTSNVDEALRRMLKGKFRHMPVVDIERRIVGIVSIRYLLTREIQRKSDSVEMLEALLGAGGPG